MRPRLIALTVAASLVLSALGAAPALAHRRPAPRGPAPAGVWDRLARCESGGRWHLNTGNGYYGGLQFDRATWRGVGGRGYPHQASREEQIRRAELLHAKRGFRPWPGCSRRLGLR